MTRTTGSVILDRLDPEGAFASADQCATTTAPRARRPGSLPYVGAFVAAWISDTLTELAS